MALEFAPPLVIGKADIDDAIAFAEASPFPAPSTLHDHVFA